MIHSSSNFLYTFFIFLYFYVYIFFNLYIFVFVDITSKSHVFWWERPLHLSSSEHLLYCWDHLSCSSRRFRSETRISVEGERERERKRRGEGGRLMWRERRFVVVVWGNRGPLGGGDDSFEHVVSQRLVVWWVSEGGEGERGVTWLSFAFLLLLFLGQFLTFKCRSFDLLCFLLYQHLCLRTLLSTFPAYGCIFWMVSREQKKEKKIEEYREEQEGRKGKKRSRR